jgi:hypothetical protein
MGGINMLSNNSLSAMSLTFEREFVWVAEYLDGSWLLEYDGME